MEDFCDNKYPNSKKKKVNNNYTHTYTYISAYA